ncbi:MAG: DUF4263 domain-containing protein [Oscillospiraceae bacterium]|nr:DUF4263 domain-containing protein [Oscillospiraceae bacterium]
MSTIELTPATPREMTDSSIDLVSTSLKTADASPIILDTTQFIQTKFQPVLVDNEHEPYKSVSGKLIYEKKQKKDTEFPTEKLTRGSIKVGEYMEIQLDTTETYNLFTGLKNLYALHDDIESIPLGSTTFTKVDSSFRQFYNIISSEPSAARLLGQTENFELVKILLQIITQSESLDSLKSSLKELESSNMASLSVAVSVECLERVLELLEANIDNDNEEDWQTIFNENQWILSQLFSCPYTIFEDKAYVGGKGIGNTNGNVCDFIYQNSMTQNIALIEIKTPCTALLGAKYRGTYSLSSDMSGAVNQILNYKDKLTKEYYASCHNSSEHFEVLNPKCFVIIGKTECLDKSQIATFENYRNSLNSVTVVTFDELLQRIKDMLAIFKTDNFEQSSAEDNWEEDFPF